jgi:hypothetical protein
MAFVSELFDQLRDLLNDAADSQVTFSMKKLYLNRAIARMFPKVYKLASTTITVLTVTYDYALPVAAADGLIVAVELERSDGSFVRFDDYDIVAGDEDLAGVFRLTVNPDRTDLLGFDIRIRYAAPVPLIVAADYTAAGSETWSGPDRAMGIPVYYAAAMCTLRKIDDRQDTLRYSTTQALNGVTDQDMMANAQLWMGQFELELQEFDRPLPPARD